MIASCSRFGRDGEALEHVFAFVAAFCDRVELEPRYRYMAEFAVEEIFTNMVKHNAAGESDVEIGLQLDDGELAMTFTDFDTRKFDINADAPEVDIMLPLEQRQPGGLGIHLVKKMMDRVEYSHSDRTGVIRLFKRVQ